MSRWSPDGSRHRLRRLGPGALVGEISFLTGGIANASVLADGAATVLQLSRNDYEALRHRLPDLALELHDFVLRGSIERIVSLNRSLTSGLI